MEIATGKQLVARNNRQAQILKGKCERAQFPETIEFWTEIQRKTRVFL